MIAPTIHTNGSSKDQLVGDLEKAMEAVRTAIDAVGECAPNARDYYPQGDAAYAQAVTEHRERMQKLLSIRSDVMELWEAIA